MRGLAATIRCSFFDYSGRRLAAATPPVIPRVAQFKDLITRNRHALRRADGSLVTAREPAVFNVVAMDDGTAYAFIAMTPGAEGEDSAQTGAIIHLSPPSSRHSVKVLDSVECSAGLFGRALGFPLLLGRTAGLGSDFQIVTLRRREVRNVSN